MILSCFVWKRGNNNSCKILSERGKFPEINVLRCNRTRKQAVLETAIIKQSTIVAIIDNHKVVFLSVIIMTLQQSLVRTTITVQHSAKHKFCQIQVTRN